MSVMAHDAAQSNTLNPNVEPSGLVNLLKASQGVLSEARDLFIDVLTTDEHLTYESRLMPGSTIGKHLRHARDHFELLLQSIQTSPPFILTYDRRLRNIPMESSISAAHDALSATIAYLEQLTSSADADPDHGKAFLTVKDHRISMDEPMTLNAVTPQMQTLQTTFGRELWFATLHAVHHWSMVRVIAGELNLSIGGTFGVAPSTLLYRGNSANSSKSRM